MTWTIAALPLVVLGIALLNLIFWPRGRAGAALPGTVSVLVPARNEASRIEATVRAALASSHPLEEVLVYDDRSTDETPAILARIAAEDPRVRVLPGVPLPEGWVGKPHACHRLAEAAKGDILCFIDADTVLETRGLEHAGDVMQRLEPDVLTAVPRQLMLTWPEKLVLPLLHLTYASWFPVPLVWRSQDPRFMAANGQLLLVRAEAYRSLGGFAAVAHEVVDDMAFCRRAKELGHRVVFADGVRMARCRMYTSAREVWEGFSKNVYEGLGGQPGALGLALALNLGAFLLPWLTLLASPWAPALLAPSAVGVGANLIERALLALRYGQPAVTVLLHPLSIASLCAIALNSWRWQRAGTISWRGRTYRPRTERRTAT